MKTPKSSFRTGFTLVELLVTIAIIAVLAAAAFTFAPKALKKAKQTASINNMRQVAILMTGYAVEHGGKLPAPREENTGENGSESNPDRPRYFHWHQAIVEETVPDATIQQILGDTEWWRAVEPITANPQFLKTEHFKPWFSGYAINFRISENVMNNSTGGGNSWFAQSRFRARLSAIPDPARTPYFVPHWDWHTSNFYQGNKLNSDPRADVFLIDGKLNVTFVDGHSELIQFAAADGERIENAEFFRRDLHRMPKF